MFVRIEGLICCESSMLWEVYMNFPLSRTLNLDTLQILSKPSRIYPSQLLKFRAFTTKPKKALALSRYLRWSRDDEAEWFPEDKMLILSAAVSRLAGYVNAEDGGVAPAAVHGVRAPCTEWTNQLNRQQSTKRKCRHLQKLTCRGTLQQVFICLRPPPNTPHPLPAAYCLSILSLTVLCYRKGGEGEELNQREGYRGNSLQSWVENTNMTD